MKRKISILLLLVLLSSIMSSCSGNKINPEIAKTGLDKESIQRINIINSRSGQKYIFSQERGRERFKNLALHAVQVKEGTTLEPDFIFDFYSETKKVASFKYIAGIDDEDAANLIDENNNFYHIDSSVENEFFKRMIRGSEDKYVTEYYTSLVDKVLEKLPRKNNAVVVVDIRKDYMVTRSLISVSQKRILDSIDVKGFEVRYPGETEKPDYYMTIDTRSYSASQRRAKTTVSVKDINNVTVKFDLELTEDGNFHIIGYN